MAPASEEQDRRSTAGTNPLLIREKGKTNGMQTVVFFWGEPEKKSLLFDSIITKKTTGLVTCGFQKNI